MSNKSLHLSIVIPCFNEEDVLPETASRIKSKLEKLIEEGTIDKNSAAYFIDDGSSDQTWKIIEGLAKQSPTFHGLKLSRNQGHQNALLAGLLTVEGDVLISLDADLQDDINAIDRMLGEYQQGAEVVYGVRSNRETDKVFKRLTAQTYYRLLDKMGVELIYNHADYRLMGRKALDSLKDFNEVNLFIRGIAPKLGYRSSTVEYSRAERFAGESKYPLGKMLKLAWEGITSFSVVPLRLITMLGFLTSLLSMFLLIWVLGIRIFTFQAVPGWASTIIPMVFLGGVQLLSLGVIGEYVAKIYLETKSRPRFIIEKKV